jgi:DNA helicase-2/ATP-dependent DNA helicase PcrA
MLNAEQEAAASAIDGVNVVIAGPGSGKTKVLIERFIRMLTGGIPQKDMLNLTFTHAAALTMVERAGLTDAKSVFRTFHSFAIGLLKEERQHLPFKLCDTVIPVGMEDYKLLFDLCKTYPAIANFRALQDKISGWKKSNILPERAITEAVDMEFFYAMAYKDYEQKCREQGWLDFDSLMQETVRLLETNEEVRNRQKRKYISVDECQDTDVVQFKMLQLLFNENIFVVGDENQLIYEWRSAQAGNLTHFARLFPNPRTLYLGQNYRSTGAIVEFLKEILPVDNGLASHMLTEREYGNRPLFVKYADETQEAEQVLALITEPAKTAIIARTNRQLFLYQRLCTMRSIKYQILGKKDFFEMNEIKKLLDFAKGSADPRPANVVLTSLIDQHNLLNIYRHSGSPMESNPIENLNSLVKMAANKGSIIEFLAYLRRLTRARKSNRGLILSTAHQMKGLQADNVFVVGAQQGKMPHDSGELQEEKRIFFVAASRAANNLQISYHGQMSQFYQHRAEEVEVYRGSDAA